MPKVKKKLTIVIAAAVLVVSAGTAYAYWTITGTGTGSASTSTGVNVTISQEASPSNLSPGGTGPLAGLIANNGTESVTIGSVTGTVDGFLIQPDADKPACTNADFSITGTTGPIVL